MFGLQEGLVDTVYVFVTIRFNFPCIITPRFCFELHNNELRCHGFILYYKPMLKDILSAPKSCRLLGRNKKIKKHMGPAE